VTSQRVHILVAHRRRVCPPPFVVVHRVRHLPAADCRSGDGLPMTLPGRAVVDAARWARSDNEARLIIAATLQQRLVTEHHVRKVLERNTTLPRRALVIRTVADAASGSHTLGELDFLALCRQGGLPLPSRQLRRQDSRGRWRYLDACFDEWGLVAEIDGAHHADVGQMWDDQARQNDLSLAGYVVLRYPAFVVREQPQRVLADLRRALLSNGWSP
jgi:very-short-patch-repair endonuclease